MGRCHIKGRPGEGTVHHPLHREVKRDASCTDEKVAHHSLALSVVIEDDIVEI